MTFRIFDDDCIAGRISQRQVPWPEAFAEAERISRKHANASNCRSFDLIHVALATLSKSTRRFATLDEGQAKLAAQCGLELVTW